MKNTREFYVLIIGYGKIGQIKAQIWKDFGARIFVSDTSSKRINKAIDDGFCDNNKFRNKYDYIDICTPTNSHIETLLSVISKQHDFKFITVEKPLFNNQTDRDRLVELLNDAPSLSNRIVVNEQYYRSKALMKLRNILSNKKIDRVEIEMSKNRIPDISEGRFIDDKIGVYGIELPHILALLSSLGISVKNAEILSNKCFSACDDNQNCGVCIELLSRDTEIIARSFIGDFALSNNTTSLISNAMTRKLVITSNGDEHTLLFDPHPSMERLYSEIITPTESITIYDNMLRSNINDIISNHIHSKCRIQSAIEQADLLMSFANNSVTQSISIKEGAIL